MSVRNLLIAASVIATGFAGGLAFAQPGPQGTAPGPHAMQQRAEHASPGRYIEGRLAFLRTELKLTQAQEPLFERLAQEMRATAATLEQRHAAHRQAASAPQPALIERLEQRSAMAKEMAAAQDRFLAALKPLYQSFSDTQKQTADELFARLAGPMGGQGMMGGKHRGARHH